MELPANPLAILTFISAPAVLTNASCVLLFGTGNRYGRAVDRMHELAEMVENGAGQDGPQLRLRIRQLEAAESRTLLIVQALRCFYTAVAGFVASTLVSLLGGVLVASRFDTGVVYSFGIAALTGTLGVVAMITGAIMLARETTFSYRILSEEKTFITSRVNAQLAKLAQE